MIHPHAEIKESSFADESHSVASIEGRAALLSYRTWARVYEPVCTVGSSEWIEL